MDSFPPKIRELAKRLLVLEGASGEAGTALATSKVIEKLRRQLATLAGVAGFHSLLSRALALATRQDHALDTLETMADGSIVGLDQRGGELDRGAGGLILITQLLGLLHIFIGDDLTLRLVEDAWPDSGWNGSFSKPEKDPKTDPAKGIASHELAE